MTPERWQRVKDVFDQVVGNHISNGEGATLTGVERSVGQGRDLHGETGS